MNQFDPAQYKEMEKEAYSRTAESYEKYGDPIFGALAAAILERAALETGEQVLDVACGTGIPALAAASLVAPGGSVTGVDLAPGMVVVAQRKAAQGGVANVSFREADAEILPFPDESFHVVLCAMGLIHMSDRPKALREMWRVLKRGGRLVLSVWSTPDKSVTLGIMARAIGEHWPRAIIPGAPTWFDFGPDGVLEAALSGAGFKDVSIGRISSVLETPDSGTYWEACLGISGKLQMLLASIPPSGAAKIEESAKQAAERFRKGDSLVIPSEQVVGLGKKV